MNEEKDVEAKEDKKAKKEKKKRKGVGYDKEGSGKKFVVENYLASQ